MYVPCSGGLRLFKSDLQLSAEEVARGIESRLLLLLADCRATKRHHVATVCFQSL